ncbi:MAG TPA: M56 family metallopeptidase [Gemmatimonadaceae bacterium]|nr:M56 family metallopeptidase [Gemmatimonadaceae bacterium]
MRAFLSELPPQLLPRLIDAAVRGAIVLLIALVLTTMLRRRSAATRHALWVGAIAAQLLLLALTVWGPRWRVAAPEPVSALVPGIEEETPRARLVQPASPSPRGPVTSLDSSASVAQVAPPSSPVARSEPATTVTAPRVSGRAILAVLWALGALAVLVRLAVGTTLVARLARHGDRIDDGGWLSLAQRLASTLGIQRPLILMRGDRIGVPITWGIVYPVVLLPDDADSWPEERRRFVLVHEMAHVKRLDALTQLVGQVALALFWFNPLVWVATRRMQLEREHACDDYVLRHGTQPSQYANDLLEMVRALGTPAHRAAQPAFAALAMARRSEFEGRMLSILDPVLDRHPLSRGRTLMSALASLLVVVPLAALQPYRAMPAALDSAGHAPLTALAPNITVQHDTQAHLNVQEHAPSAERAGKLDSLDQLLAHDVDVLNEAVARQDAQTKTVIAAPMRACDEVSFAGSKSRTSMHVHTGDDASGVQMNYLNVQADRCTQAMIAGKVTFTPTEEDVASLSDGARVYVRERSAQDDRALSITRGSDGALVRSFQRNGANAPYDDDARRWLARFLPAIIAETGENAAPRVARWRAEGGVDGALRHIGALKSSGAKRAHFEALLDDKKLSAVDAEHIVQQAGRTVPSSGDLRSVLSKAAPQIRAKSGSASALEEAIGAVASSGDRTAVLEEYGKTNDRDMLLAVMRIAQTIPSSGDKSNLLTELAARYLGTNDKALRDAFFATAITIPSSGDLANVLDDAVPFAAKSNEIALAVIEATSHIASSGDRSNVLVALADAGAVKTDAARDAYLRAAKDIPSSSDARGVLEAITRH